MPDQGIFSGSPIPGTFMLNLPTRDRLGLEEVAAERGMSSSEWLESMIAAHIGGRPSWNKVETQDLESIVRVTSQVVALLGANATGKDAALTEIETLFRGIKRLVSDVTDRQRRYWRLPA